MAKYDYDIGIIGGGAAGLTVASGASQLGGKTLLIEKERELGGDCLHYGCVPSKTLIKTAHVYHQMKSGSSFGLPQFTPPPVDFKEVSRRIQSVIGVIQNHDSVERFCKLGTQVEFGNVRFIDEHAVSLNGKTVSARNWLIATGSSAAVPPIEGLDVTPYLTNREIFSLETLPVSLIILGGGPIGIEMAQAFSRLGSQVTVIDGGGQILGKEDADMAGLVQKVLEGEGVRFLLNTSILRVGSANGRREVLVENAAKESSTIVGEQVLVALGRSPNVDGLGLKNIDVAYDRRGIQVNEKLRTRHKHIYAAGDVSGGLQFTHVAGYEGGVVLSNAIFHLPKKTDYTHVPWCTYTHPELASIGMNETSAKAAGVKYSVWTEQFSDNDRGLAEGETVGHVKLLLGKNSKPLGVQILGPHAGELISEWVAIMNGKVGMSKIASAVHPYPTLGEINKRVVGSIFSEKLFSSTVRNVLKFFFRLQGRACSVDGSKKIKL